jgi:hypothetical protein
MKKALNTVGKNYGNFNFSSTPKWARVCQIAGLAIGSIGAGIVASPALFPAAVVSAAGYMIFGGSVATAFFQGFRKSQQ